MNNAGSSTITQLPLPTQSQLRSTQILTSLTQVLSELIQNSLDAKATQIDIGVDCEGWECWVRDNGVGIKKDDLSLLAKVGRYGTSKAYSPTSLDQVETFGFRGEALASAADLSCLEIASRPVRSLESWSIIMKGGQSLYDGPSLRWRRESPGTVVCMRDVFYNLPVRRLSHPSPQRTLELVRKEIETFALVSPDVSFSLESTSKAGGGRSDKIRVLSVPKTKSSLATFRHLFGRAFAEHVDEIDESLEDMSINGFISLEGAHSRVSLSSSVPVLVLISTSKSYQYIYLNRRPLSLCNLQRLIDQKFSSSSFGKHAYDEHGQNLERPSTRRSPRKSEKRPIYVLNISLPPKRVDNCLEPSKGVVHISDMGSLTDFLSATIQAFLIRHRFASKPSKKSRTVTSRPESPTPTKRKFIGADLSGTLGSKFRQMNLSYSSRDRSPPNVSADPIRSSEPLMVDPDEDDITSNDIIWKDPQTGRKFIVDRRTGNSRPYSEVPDQNDSDPETVPDKHVAKRRRTLKALSQDIQHEAGVEVPQWIQEALQSNNVFALQEPRIPTLNLSSLISSISGEHRCDAHSYTKWKDILAGLQGSSQSSRFGRDALRDAIILGQVDKKFIAFLVDAPDLDESFNDNSNLEAHQGRTLVLLDQHAADERVRVERFLRELCTGFLNYQAVDQTPGGVETRILEPPLPVLLTRHEACQIVKSANMQKTMERWGICFSDLDKCQSPTIDDPVDEIFRPKPPSSGYIQVFVSHVPEILADKLITGDELRNVLKGFISHLDLVGHPGSQMPPASQPTTRDEKSTWQRAMRWCPKELLDLVNSKACRGAIMFNDPLTSEQCHRLVHQLADTAFPFQCAHGRPSLVPLTGMTKFAANGSIRSSSAVRPLDWGRMPTS